MIECPHCKHLFRVPWKRHLPGREKWGLTHTYCGIDDRKGALIAKPGETVNCETCINRKQRTEKP